MTTLLVKTRAPEPEVTRIISHLVVYDVRKGNPLNVDSIPGKAQLFAGSQFGTAGIAVPTELALDYRVKPAELFVAYADVDNHIRYKRSVIRVQSVEKAETAIAKPVDTNQIPTQAGETIPLTNVDLDLAVSFDTFFDFNMRSIEGIRSVLDENNQVIESAYDSYRLTDLVPGQGTKRTILTNNDFRMTLNIRPTIVKSAKS